MEPSAPLFSREDKSDAVSEPFESPSAESAFDDERSELIFCAFFCWAAVLVFELLFAAVLAFEPLLYAEPVFAALLVAFEPVLFVLALLFAVVLFDDGPE